MAKELKKKGNRTVVVDTDNDNPEEKTKTEKPKTEQTPAEKNSAKPLEEQVLAVMQALTQNGIKEFTSTVLRDKLSLDKESGRDQIRRAMKRLAKDGKVTITEKTHGKHKQYVYVLK